MKRNATRRCTSRRQAPPCATYEVWPEVREQLDASCDLGSSADELCAAFPELHAAVTAGVGDDATREVWWHDPAVAAALEPERLATLSRASSARASRASFQERPFVEPLEAVLARVDAFAARLSMRPETAIVVFGHCDFFHLFLERHCGQADVWLENCEIRPLRIERPLGQDPPALARAARVPEDGDAREDTNEDEDEDEPAPAPAPSAARLALANLKAQIRAENPGMPEPQVLRTAAQRWKALTPQQRTQRIAQYTPAGPDVE